MTEENYEDSPLVVLYNNILLNLRKNLYIDTTKGGKAETGWKTQINKINDVKLVKDYLDEINTAKGYLITLRGLEKNNDMQIRLVHMKRGKDAEKQFDSHKNDLDKLTSLIQKRQKIIENILPKYTPNLDDDENTEEKIDTEGNSIQPETEKKKGKTGLDLGELQKKTKNMRRKEEKIIEKQTPQKIKPTPVNKFKNELKKHEKVYNEFMNLLKRDDVKITDLNRVIETFVKFNVVETNPDESNNLMDLWNASREHFINEINTDHNKRMSTLSKEEMEEKIKPRRIKLEEYERNLRQKQDQGPPDDPDDPDTTGDRRNNLRGEPVDNELVSNMMFQPDFMGNEPQTIMEVRNADKTQILYRIVKPQEDETILNPTFSLETLTKKNKLTQKEREDFQEAIRFVPKEQAITQMPYQIDEEDPYNTNPFNNYVNVSQNLTRDELTNTFNMERLKWQQYFDKMNYNKDLRSPELVRPSMEELTHTYKKHSDHGFTYANEFRPRPDLDGFNEVMVFPDHSNIGYEEAAVHKVYDDPTDGYRLF